MTKIHTEIRRFDFGRRCERVYLHAGPVDVNKWFEDYVLLKITEAYVTSDLSNVPEECAELFFAFKDHVNQDFRKDLQLVVSRTEYKFKPERAEPLWGLRSSLWSAFA